MSSNIYDPSTKTLVPIAGNASNSLNMLDDVALSALSNGQVLTYDAANQVWKNATSSGGGGGGGGGHTIEDSIGTDLTQRDTLQFGEGFLAEDDNTNQKTVISPDIMQSGDIDDIITPLPSIRPSRSTIIKQALQIGATTITFNDIPTTGDYVVNFYNSLGINYSSIIPSSGSVTLTFPAQSVAVDVYCEIREV